MKLKNFCKLGRAGCPNLQKLPKGDTEARTIYSKDGLELEPTVPDFHPQNQLMFPPCFLKLFFFFSYCE